MHFWRAIVYFLVNKIFAGTNPHYFKLKASLLRTIGYTIGKNTLIVGPITCTGRLSIGDNCWIGTNLKIHGNGNVFIGNNIDIAPDVTFLTGTHYIGTEERRAGQGYNTTIRVEDGCWLGGKSVFVNEITIGTMSVAAAGAVVCKDVPANSLVGGVPAKIIKSLKS